MESLFWLAGSLAAHGIWSVSDGSPLVPMLGHDLRSGQQHMMRLLGDNLEDGVALGRDKLESNDDEAARAVLIFDAYITDEHGETDALMVDGRDYDSNAGVTLAVPYRAADKPEGFAVFAPKFLSFSGSESQLPDLAEVFFQGVDAHGEAAAVWNQYWSESRSS